MRVLIGPISSPAGKLHIKERLEWAPPGMVSTNDVVLEDEWPSVLEAVARGLQEPARRYDVLIAEFRLPGSPSFAAINAIDPTFSVIDIDLLGGTSNMPMFDVGSEKLRRLAEWLTRESGLTSTPAEIARLAAFQGGEETGKEVEDLPAPPAEAGPRDGPEEPKALGPPSPPRLVLAPPTASAPEADAQLGDVARWLELKLGLMLARAEAGSQGQDFPGWTISAARARALLGNDIARLSAEGLQEQWRRVDARLHAHVEAAAHARPEASPGWIAHAFRLDRIEREMLWLAAAPDMAGSFAQAIGFLNDDLAQRRPTLSLLSRAIDGAGPPWQLQRRLAGDAPFARFRLASLVRTDPLIPESLAPIVAAPDVVAMLLGRRPGDVVEGATLYDPADFRGETFDLQVAPVLGAARALDRDRNAPPIVHFHAPAYEAGWLAAQLASVDKSALVGDVGPAAEAEPGAIHDRLYAFARAARVADAVLIVTGADELAEARRGEIAETLVGQLAPHLKLVALQGMHTDPTGLRGAAGGVLEIGRDRASREERATIWTRAAAARGIELSNEAARELAATFAFSRAQAEAALALALAAAAIDTGETADEALRHAARLVSKASAPASVRRIETGPRLGGYRAAGAGHGRAAQHSFASEAWRDGVGAMGLR